MVLRAKESSFLADAKKTMTEPRTTSCVARTWLILPGGRIGEVCLVAGRPLPVWPAWFNIVVPICPPQCSQYTSLSMVSSMWSQVQSLLDIFFFEYLTKFSTEKACVGVTRQQLNHELFWFGPLDKLLEQLWSVRLPSTEARVNSICFFAHYGKEPGVAVPAFLSYFPLEVHGESGEWPYDSFVVTWSSGCWRLHRPHCFVPHASRAVTAVPVFMRQCKILDTCRRSFKHSGTRVAKSIMSHREWHLATFCRNTRLFSCPWSYSQSCYVLLLWFGSYLQDLLEVDQQMVCLFRGR